MRAKALKMCELEIAMLAEHHISASASINDLLLAMRELHFGPADHFLDTYEERIKTALQTLKDLRRHLNEIGED